MTFYQEMSITDPLIILACPTLLESLLAAKMTQNMQIELQKTSSPDNFDLTYYQKI